MRDENLRKEKRIQPGRHGKAGRLQGKRLWLAAVLALALTAFAGTVLARYIWNNQKKAEMISSRFHISSDYLEETEKEYTVTGSGEIKIRLFNYEKENVAQRSEDAMKYSVDVTGGKVQRVEKEGGAAVTPEGGSGIYTLEKSDGNTYHELYITPADMAAGRIITVKVTTTSPYKKTLQASFKLQGSKQPEYTAADQGDGTVLVTVKTNTYSGNMTVRWDTTKLSPDNTNALMSSWTDAGGSGTFSAEQNSTYSLLFFKKTTAAYNESDITITWN